RERRGDPLPWSVRRPSSPVRRSFRGAPAAHPRASIRSGGRKGSRSFAAFVMIAHEAIEKADAIARRPGLADLAGRRVHGRAGDIEMRPRRITDEALEELRSCNRAGMAAGGILHVGKFRIDHLVVF